MKTENELKAEMRERMGNALSEFKAKLDVEFRKATDWVGTASKERLKTAVNVERMRSDKMELLLKEATAELKAGRGREASLERRLAEAFHPVETAIERVRGLETTVESALKDVAGAVEKVVRIQAQLNKERGDAEKSVLGLLEETKALNGGLQKIREDLNGRIGTLNDKLKKAGQPALGEEKAAATAAG